MPDYDLSLAALGLLWHLLERPMPAFTIADVQTLELGGMSRDRASRLVNELRAVGYVRRTRGGFVMDGAAAEAQWSTDARPAPVATPPAAYTAAICA